MESDHSDEHRSDAQIMLENFKMRHIHLFKTQNSNGNPSPKIIKIYDEIFEDHSCIVNFMNILKGSPEVDSSDVKSKQAQMTIFNILNNLCTCSIKI